MIRTRVKLNLRPFLRCVAVFFVCCVGIKAMQPPIKSILKKQSKMKRAKRVAFKAQTIYICWSAWRRPLFSDTYLPLSPLFDPRVVQDLGIIEIEDL